MLKNNKVISLILSVLLIISMISLILNITLKQNVFNEAWYKDTAKREGLNKEIKDKVEEKLKLVTTESNFPETLYQNIVTDEMIDSNVDKILEENVKVLNKQEYNQNIVNVNDIINAYNQRIDEYVASRNAVMDEDAINVINTIKSKAQKEVTDAIYSINFWTFIENHKDSTALNMLLNVSAFSSLTIMIISIIGIMLTTLGLFFINSNDLTAFLKYVGTALFIGGAVPFSIGLGGNLSNIARNISFMGFAANKLLTLLINSIFSSLTVFGLIIIVMGTIAIIISTLKVSRRVRSSLSKKVV